MGADGNPNTYGEFYRSFASMIEANEDMIHAGVPGPGPVSITTSSAGYKISQLGVRHTGTVGILHFPSAFAQTPEPSQAKADVSVDLKALVAGSYVVQTCRAGKVALRAPSSWAPTKPIASWFRAPARRKPSSSK